MQEEFQSGSGAVGWTYVYLGFTSISADHVQLLDGQRVSAQPQADVVRVVAVLIVEQSYPRFGLLEQRRYELNHWFPICRWFYDILRFTF